MARQFYTEGTGNQQTLHTAQKEKVPVYNTEADAVADLSNLEENQIGITKDTGNELSQPVNAVESGNLHAVTSNAVAGALNNYIPNAITAEGSMIIKEIRYVTGTMPADSSQISYINTPDIGNGEYIIILGGRVIRTSTEGFEYDIPTVGTCLYESVNHRFYISIRPEFVTYVGGKPIGVLYAVLKLA